MTGGDGFVEEALGGVAVGGDDAGHPPCPGNTFERLEPFEERPIDEGVAVDREAIEEPHLPTDGLAVEDQLSCRERADHLDDVGPVLGHVVQIAREETDIVAPAVHLKPDAVELPLDRRLFEQSDSLCDRRTRCREHRLHRMQRRQTER